MLTDPDLRYHSVYDIDLNLLQKMGVKLLMIDIDNTLVSWGSREAGDDLREWVAKAKGMFEVVLFSNRKKAGTVEFAGSLGLKQISPAYKPIPFRLISQSKSLGFGPAKTAVVGDQLVTDVIAGKLSGCRTVLVEPIAKKEFLGTKINRAVERWIFGRRPFSKS